MIKGCDTLTNMPNLLQKNSANNHRREISSSEWPICILKIRDQ